MLKKNNIYRGVFLLFLGVLFWYLTTLNLNEKFTSDFAPNVDESGAYEPKKINAQNATVNSSLRNDSSEVRASSSNLPTPWQSSAEYTPQSLSTL
jgi:hypothetical protein